MPLIDLYGHDDIRAQLSTSVAAGKLPGSLPFHGSPGVGKQRLALWLGQLLGAAWLGLAALNWINRRLILGGVFGRPIVLANAVPYFISAMVLIRAAIHQPQASVELMAIATITLAVAYGALLFRGPFDRPR